MSNLWEGEKIFVIYAFRDRKLKFQAQTHYLGMNKRIIFKVSWRNRRENMA
jgi:hypothetical protein